MRCDSVSLQNLSPSDSLQRRRSQNRTAQRAYRDREKQRLHVALQRVREVECDLNEAVSMQKHYQSLYEKVHTEYEELWDSLFEFDARTVLSSGELLDMSAPETFSPPMQTFDSTTRRSNFL